VSRWKSRTNKDGIEEGRKQWRKGVVVGSLAIGFQAAILGLALLIGVLDPKPPQEAKLKLPPGSPTQQRERQNQLNNQLAQLNRLQKDSLQKLMDPILESTRPDISVPQPDVMTSFKAMGAMLPVSNMFQGSMDAFTSGAEVDSLPPPDPVSFLGENLSAKRIVLLLDVSSSVKSKMERAGVSMDQLRKEVIQFIEQLGPNHLFGIIQFTRNWQAFKEDLLPGTQMVKDEALSWLNSQFRTTGTSGRNWTRGSPNGIEGVLAAAFEMDPQIDEVFLVCDGDFQRTPSGGGGQDVPWAELRKLTRELQDESIGETRLRILCFYPPEEAIPDLRAWVRENGPGTLRNHTNKQSN